MISDSTPKAPPCAFVYSDVDTSQVGEGLAFPRYAIPLDSERGILVSVAAIDPMNDASASSLGVSSSVRAEHVAAWLSAITADSSRLRTARSQAISSLADVVELTGPQGTNRAIPSDSGAQHLFRAKQEIAGYRDLSDGWDGCRARQISLDAIDATVALLDRLDRALRGTSEALVRCEPSPTADGGIALEVEANECALDILVAGLGERTGYFLRGVNRSEEATLRAADFTVGRFRSLLRLASTQGKDELERIEVAAA